MVCLVLYGGNDANNMIVPTSNTEYGQYAAARGALALPKESLRALNPLVGDGRTYLRDERHHAWTVERGTYPRSPDWRNGGGSAS